MARPLKELFQELNRAAIEDPWEKYPKDLDYVKMFSAKKSGWEYQQVERKHLAEAKKLGWEYAYPNYAYHGNLVILKRKKVAKE